MAEDLETVIIISRDRTELLQKSLAYWDRQPVHVILKTEPDQVDEYAEALSGRRLEIIPHDLSDMGVGYARQSALQTAVDRGIDAFIMADDDTVVTKGDVRAITNFVRTGRAMCCGAWMSIHDLWYGPIRKQEGWVVPHFGDKIYAVNARLLDAIGGYDTSPLIGTYDTAELNRISISSGYLWWIHTSTRSKELGYTAAPGGIAAVPVKRPCPTCGGITERIISRDENRLISQQYVRDKWGSVYISAPGVRWNTGLDDFIRDHMGAEAAAIHRNKHPFRADDPNIPHGLVGSAQLHRQLEMLAPSPTESGACSCP